MNHHTLAAISITGTCLDVLGSLYLAYDLLGGRYGPLRLLTRAVTYSIIFGIGYGLGLGLFFGFASGITVAIEFNRAARGLEHYSLPWEALFSAIRGLGFSLGLYRILGLRFALAFGVLLTIGQVFAYARGMRPATDYDASGPAASHPPSILGNSGSDHRLSCHRAHLQRLRSPRGSRLGVCHSRRIGDRPGDRHRYRD